MKDRVLLILLVGFIFGFIYVIQEIIDYGKKKKGNKICPAGIAWAKRTFDKYPSAYANMAASKYCKDPNYGK